MSSALLATLRVFIPRPPIFRLPVTEQLIPRSLGSAT